MSPGTLSKHRGGGRTHSSFLFGAAILGFFVTLALIIGLHYFAPILAGSPFAGILTADPLVLSAATLATTGIAGLMIYANLNQSSQLNAKVREASDILVRIEQLHAQGEAIAGSTDDERKLEARERARKVPLGWATRVDAPVADAVRSYLDNPSPDNPSARRAALTALAEYAAGPSQHSAAPEGQSGESELEQRVSIVRDLLTTALEISGKPGSGIHIYSGGSKALAHRTK